jgi:FkbM family methyltransferase
MHGLQFRLTDLAIKALIKRQHMHVKPSSPPRLAAIAKEHVGIAIASTGLYESDEIDLVRRLLSAENLSQTVMLDIGANIGNHACALAPFVSRVLAFEPNPPTAALLKANALLNNFSSVTVHEVGLAESDAELPYGIVEDGNDGSGSFAGGLSTKTLPVRNGDSFLAKHEPMIAESGQRIGFIKCDVQGFERDVFAGLSQTLRKHQPVIMFESDSQGDGMASWRVLQECGYANLMQVRAPGDTSGKLAREWARMRKGTACWLENIDTVPDGHCNLMASVRPLPRELFPPG